MITRWMIDVREVLLIGLIACGGTTVCFGDLSPVATVNWGHAGPFVGIPLHTDDQFGFALDSLGTNRFLVGIPRREGDELPLGNYEENSGVVAIYSSEGGLLKIVPPPEATAGDQFGSSVAHIGDSLFAVGAPFADARGGRGGTIPNSGTVYIFEENGTYLRLIENPNPARNSRFGCSLVGLGSDRIVIGASSDRSSEQTGSAYVYEASGTLIKRIINPETHGDHFGIAVAAIGSNRFVVGANGDDQEGVDAGRAYLYDFDGTLIKEITAASLMSDDAFGSSVTGVGTNGFVVGAPSTDFMPLGSTTGSVGNAGAVYIFDWDGNLTMKIDHPTPRESAVFGQTLTAVGEGRFLVGAVLDKVSGITFAGAAYLYNFEGDLLSTVLNPPPPGEFDYFGDAVAGIGEDRFVVGARLDDTNQRNSGSVYVYHAPILEYTLGSRIPIPEGLNLDLLPENGPEVEPAGAAFWHIPNKELYAVEPGSVIIRWTQGEDPGINVQALNVWSPDDADYQTHVLGTPPVNLKEAGAYDHIELLTEDSTVGVSTGDVDISISGKFNPTGTGRSLLLLSSGHPNENPIFFQAVRTVAWSDSLIDNVPATVGDEITEISGHESICGGAHVFWPISPYCPGSNFYDRVERTGPIIPVNTDKAGETNDLVLVAYQQGAKLKNGTGDPVASPICWPWQALRYNVAWPDDTTNKIVIASTLGSRPIDPVLFKNWNIYVQNDSGLPGFNPNDEHALSKSGIIYAIRDDLGTPTTSEPYVLMTYLDTDNEDRGQIKVFKVMAEEDPYFFNYPGVAGTRVQPPLPLSALQLCDESAGVSGPYWRDRKQDFWARSAGDDGEAAQIVMSFYYPVQPGFFFPSGPAPPLGTCVPWLDLRAGTPGTPIHIGYTISWPTAAELRIYETLVKPKFGLPDISLQTSVEILYEQADALSSGQSSVRLIDPTRERSVSLDELPDDVETVREAGLDYFPTLPPSLRNRFRYDPINKLLTFHGELVEPSAGEYYLLLNVITDREKAVLLALSDDAVFESAINELAQDASEAIEVRRDATEFDSLALTAGFADAPGYVTLAFANNTNLSAKAEPVELEVIRVTCPNYDGELKVIESENPFDEQLTLRHSGDFAGETDSYEFEWRTEPPVDGLPPTNALENWSFWTPTPATGVGAVDITIAGSGLLTLSDNYFVCRYRRVLPSGAPLDPSLCGGDGWSTWTTPQLAEGWIKRVLRGINPFEQRIASYRDDQVNTMVTMIGQAGPRSVGNVPLNQAAANEFGLIETYETVLNRGRKLSIDGTPAVNYPPANDALLLAAGRIADLYMLLGNEAYADGSDPTIAFGTSHGVYGAEAPSIHCFMNQTASLLEEELTLFRGRDDALQPGVQNYPVYNRLIWNFTSSIDGGEVAYALNYNIRDLDGDVKGSIDEADAQILYPQGHGDAWGHYLTAIKNYYRLLQNPQFEWVPRIEAVLVGGIPVSVDFLDERKFARVAAARARTGSEIVNLTYRSHYVEDPNGQYQGYLDPDEERAWGVAEWGSRAGQGAFLDWVAANALLPEIDNNPDHVGIQIVDRTTVLELREILSAFLDIQGQVDAADRGLNPLGLAKNVIPFDIDPSLVASGETHFEQIYGRAVNSLNNAISVFNYANNSSQQLRQQADEVSTFQQTVINREADFNSRLIEVFGYPYVDDIGPTGAYDSGYDGPDIYHYDYVDPRELAGVGDLDTQIRKVSMKTLSVTPEGAVQSSSRLIDFHVGPHGFGLIKPGSWTGQRRAPGDIQMARSELFQTRIRFQQAVENYANLVARISDGADLLKAQYNVDAATILLMNVSAQNTVFLNDEIAKRQSEQADWQGAIRISQLVADAAAEALALVVGVASDPTSVARGAIKMVQAVSAEVFQRQSEDAAAEELELIQTKEENQNLDQIQLTTVRQDFAIQQQLKQLEQLVREEVGLRLELFALEESLQQISGRYLTVLARGQRLLEDRLRFRQQTAGEVQAYRYKDMAFRIFRNDALQKYRAQFDLAARYVFLAAKTYDFETNLRPGDPRGPGEDLMTEIIRSRTLGIVQDGLPQTASGQGDAGLADPMARMFQNWELVLKGQLGFNNPQTETGRFSLRSELFRISGGLQGSAAWREMLAQHIVPNVLDLPEFQRYCIPFLPQQPEEPAIVIPFSTTINFGLNFFGWPAGGGDNDYDSSHFATKIRSVGVWFANYNNLGGGMINTPRVYLIPVGNDILRSPSSLSGEIREWTLLDQALPVPFPLSLGALGNEEWIPANDTLVGELGDIRKHARFRAYHDSGSFSPAETIDNNRLIGRSVWNTRWLLIIPAGTLHGDRQEGLERFIHGALFNDERDGNGVSDIKIFFQTYSYSGS